MKSCEFLVIVLLTLVFLKWFISKHRFTKLSDSYTAAIPSYLPRTKAHLFRFRTAFGLPT